MKLIVGLGNIGSQYAQTRHNLGFRVINELARRHDLSFKEDKKLHALVTKGEIAGETVLLTKPTTMMNLSGGSVSALMHYYKLNPSDVWVVHDELDLEFGKIRTRIGGGTAGHNGIGSIIEAISPDFIRWRIGIGRPPAGKDSAAYVLDRFTAGEEAKIEGIVGEVAADLTTALKTGHEPTTRSL